MKRIVKIGMTLAVGGLLSGCSLGGWFAGRGDLASVSEIARANLCSAEGETSRLTLFRSSEETLAWQQRTGIDLKLDADLKPGRYALIEMGQRHTGGYGIAVSREAREVNGVLQVYTTYFAPPADAMAIQMISSPCVLVRLPNALYDAIEIYDQDGELRASGTTRLPSPLGN